MDRDQPINPDDLPRLHEYIPRRAYLEELLKNGEASESEKNELAALRRDLAERLQLPPHNDNDLNTG